MAVLNSSPLQEESPSSGRSYPRADLDKFYHRSCNTRSSGKEYTEEKRPRLSLRTNENISIEFIVV